MRVIEWLLRTIDRQGEALVIEAMRRAGWKKVSRFIVTKRGIRLQ